MIELLTPVDVDEPRTHWSSTGEQIARAIGDPSRLRILMALMDGRAYTATTLALEARVAPSTASAHLSQLVEAGLVRRANSPLGGGRYRYYEIAGYEVAEALEALGAIAPALLPASLLPGSRVHGLRTARVCYDHLAGRVAIALMDAFTKRGMLVPHDAGLALTAEGEFQFERFGLDLNTIRHADRPLIKPHTDWSEQRPHLAGALGAAFLRQCERRGWLARVPVDRMMTITPAGGQGLRQWFGVELPD